MAGKQDIDEILKNWEFDPLGLNVRKLQTESREVLQMRVDMGVLQLEVTDRPDGSRPFGHPTMLDYLHSLTPVDDEAPGLSDNEMLEVDREFVQFYHRRICWLQLKEFANVVRDAKHTLQLMDACRVCSSDEKWTLSHEQYRPFVMYHRTQAAALHLLEVTEDPESAIECINHGLDELREVFETFDALEQFENDELVQRLTEFRENLRARYEIGETLEERLQKAIENEQYEQAAKLRDELANRKSL